MNGMVGGGMVAGKAGYVQLLMELPILMYFALHFFPPGPAALMNVSLLLAVVWAAANWRSAKQLSFQGSPLFLMLGWLLLAGLLGLSICFLPAVQQAPSAARYLSWIGKGTLFGTVLLLYISDRERARRLVLAAVVAALVIVIHLALSTIKAVHETGVYPLQRDYVYWLLPFFSFALAGFAFKLGWRTLAAMAVVAIVSLAVVTGFRGAMLALVTMFVLSSFFVDTKKILLIGVVVGAIGTLALLIVAPERGQYVLMKLHQTDSSLRALGLWLPTWDMALEGPWFGHGYGDNVFAKYYMEALPSHPKWTPMTPLEVKGVNYMSPHGIVFEVLFALGFPGVIMLGAIFAGVFWALLSCWRQRAAIADDPLLILGVAALIALVGNHGILGMTDAPSWRTLPILLAIAVAALSRRRSLAQAATPGN